jgi:hypothetical protein
LELSGFFAIKPMNRFLITLLSSPMLLGSILSTAVMVNQAQAIEPAVKTNADRLTCIRNKHKVGLVCARASELAKIPTYQAEAQPSNEDTFMLQFSEQESDIAIAFFGCDCAACINSLRQMRRVEPLVY